MTALSPAPSPLPYDAIRAALNAASTESGRVMELLSGPAPKSSASLSKADRNRLNGALLGSNTATLEAKRAAELLAHTSADPIRVAEPLADAAFELRFHGGVLSGIVGAGRTPINARWYDDARDAAESLQLLAQIGLEKLPDERP
jgi:hypothetical protein